MAKRLENKANKRGSRLSQNLVRVSQQASNQQFSVTIPKGIALALGYKKGDVMEVLIENGNIVLKKKK